MLKIIQFYLRFWAKIYLKRTEPKIIAITGSVGKTSTREAVFAVLAQKFGQDVRQSYGNLNTETGVPLAILGYKKSPHSFFDWLKIVITFPFRAISERKFKFLVLEMAADKTGDIKYLTSFVWPDIAVLTTIGPSHLAAFGTMENIVREKTTLLTALPKDGIAILNIDDDLIRKVFYGGWWQKISFGQKEADVSGKLLITKIDNLKPLSKIMVKTSKGQVELELNVLGSDGNFYAVLAAVATGIALNIDLETIAAGLKNYEPQKHRTNILAGKNHSIIIDDSYNASPVSMKAALEVLSQIKASRKIVCLGDMREIGPITDSAHQEIGKIAQKVADIVVSVGPDAKKYGGKHFSSANEAADYLLSILKENDILLVKASRAIGLDKVVEKIKAD